MKERYNGWENYETYLVNLWLNTDEGAYFHAQKLIESIIEEGKLEEGELNDKIHELSHRLSNHLKSFVFEDYPDLCNSIHSNLLRFALCSVNYYELAEALLKGFYEEYA